MNAHVAVWRYFPPYPGEHLPWTWLCDDPGCVAPHQRTGGDHETHAEALAAALEHCRTSPRKTEATA